MVLLRQHFAFIIRHHTDTWQKVVEKDACPAALWGSLAEWGSLLDCGCRAQACREPPMLLNFHMCKKAARKVLAAPIWVGQGCRAL